MKITKRNDKKYPIIATLSTGEKLLIPKQSEFDNDWLRHHGCSLMAEYVALQWLGVEKIKDNRRTVGIYPINLLNWHRKHTPKDVKSKVTVRGVSKGINQIAKSKGKSRYYKVVTASRIRKAIRSGYTVIMEQDNPIHSIFLMHDEDGTFMVSYGKVTKVNIDHIASTATKNATYRGMVVIREVYA